MNDQLVRFLIPLIGGSALVYLILFIRGIYVQKRQNTINEINFEGKQINLKDSTEPLNDLINDANKDMGTPPGDSTTPKK